MGTPTEDKSTTKAVINKKVLLATVVALLVVCLAVGGFLLWRSNQPRSLLPTTVAKQITDFTPYFFFDEVPGGYSLNEKLISFDQEIVIMPLTTPDLPPIVLTEQALPETLSQDLLQEKDSIIVKNTAAPAIINKVEGRMVGIITSKKHKLLLLINAPSTMHQEDMTEMLQGLKPID